MSDKIERIGDFLYIEPNDILESANNVTHNYEDYSMNVELEVKIPNRGVWVNNSAQTGRVTANKKSTKESISFFSGNNDYLTSTPGSIIYKDILNSKQDRESLGITSIHISYNSYFYPQVTIQFSDIRGMGLMMPHEEVYRQEITNSTDENKKRTEKFFAALFTFPSPEFILRVKGFYGKKVQYSLMVENIHSSFNNQTGNFEVTVKFIGKMYGVYTDIPMSHILIAPYCKYGNNNSTLWENMRLTFPDTNIRIPTLLKLKKQLLTATNEVENNLSYILNEKTSELDSKEKYLSRVQNAYNNFNKIIESFPDSYGIIRKDNIILIPPGKNADNTNSYDHLYGENNCSGLKDITTELYRSIKEYNDNDNTKTIIYLLPFETENYIISSNNNKYIVTFHKDEKGQTVVDNNDNNKKIKENFTDDLKSAITFKQNEETKRYFVIDCNEFVTILTTISEGFRQARNTINAEIKDESSYEISKSLGFDLTIKNVFTILMAHLHAYTKLLTNCLTDIYNDKGRTFKSKKINSKNLPDIPTGISENDTIPAFPAMKNNEGEFCYFNDISLNPNEFYEDSLIEHLFVGSSSVIDEIEDIKKLESLYQEGNNTFIPTCITDFNSPIFSDRNINPYSHVFDVEDMNADWILFFFAMRCVQKFMMEREDIDPNDFGKYEAYNLWLAYPLLHKEYKHIFDAVIDNNNAIYFENFITSTDKCYVATGAKQLVEKKKCRNKTEVFSIPVIGNEKNCMPASIGLGGGFSKYQQECRGIEGEDEDISNLMSYLGCKEEVITTLDTQRNYNLVRRPYGLMNSIEESILEKWDTNNKTLTNLPEDTQTKHDIFTSKYLEKKNNLYFSHKGSDAWFKSDTKHKNSAWNVMYSKVSNKQFFNEIDGFLATKKEFSILNDAFNDGDLLLSVFNTQNDKAGTRTNKLIQSPVFILNNLLPEDILTAIPHNIEQVAKDLLNGNTILRMPYSTKLFIGYVISLIQKNYKDKDEFIETLVELVNKSIGNQLIFDTVNNDVRKIELDFYRSDYKINNKEEHVAANYLIALFKILFCVTTNENYVTHAPTEMTTGVFGLWGDSYISYNYDNYGQVNNELEQIFDGLWDSKQVGFFTNDIFGFKREYDEWSKNQNVGGFNYFKEHLWLEMDTNNKTPASTMFDLLKSEFKKGSVNEGVLLQKISNMFQEKNKFNEIYGNVYFDTHNKTLSLVFRNDNAYVRDFDAFLKKIEYFILPYSLHSKIENWVEIDGQKQTLIADKMKFYDAYTNFIKTLKILYNNDKQDEVIYTVGNVDYRLTTNQKLSLYQTLKNLYDKHFMGIEMDDNWEKYDINSKTPQSEINRFHFINGFYKDIGNTLYLNPETINSLIETITDGYTSGKGEGAMQSEMSFYSFMSLLCQKHNLLFIATPIFNGSCDNDADYDNIKAMFKPLTYKESCMDKNALYGPSYICYYPSQPSQHLELPISQYANDGFMIKKDINGTDDFQGPLSVSEFQRNGYSIPAFGVEYGSQKQSIFQNIVVNMDNPQVTEVAIANQFNIANNNNKNVKMLQVEGQDLFKIYSNYSYTCQVEMLGCAQIQPLMYFQLNNIPMFRGAYQIINVEHIITPGNMTTTFKGVRINKTQIPMSNNAIQIDFKSIMSKNNVVKSTINNFKYNYVNIDSSLIHNEKMKESNKSHISAQYLKNNYGEWVTFQNNNLLPYFNRLNPSLRQLMYCIIQDLPALSDKLGYKVGIVITSATRDNATRNSYHRRRTNDHSETFTKNKRDGYSGYMLSDNGLSYVVDDENKPLMVDYDRMGCAIDFRATRNNKDEKYNNDDNQNVMEATINLFQHIAIKYQEYIKQLIWEVRGDEPIDLIHLASLGEPQNDQQKGIKGQILAARLKTEPGKLTTTQTLKTCAEMPDAYKEVCKNIPQTHVNIVLGNC